MDGTTCQAMAIDRRLADDFTIDLATGGALVAAHSDTRQGGAVSLPEFVRQQNTRQTHRTDPAPTLLSVTGAGRRVLPRTGPKYGLEASSVVRMVRWTTRDGACIVAGHPCAETRRYVFERQQTGWARWH